MKGRPAKDVECFKNPKFTEILAKSMGGAFKQGGMGVAWTSGLYDDWGFDLKDVDGKGCHALARERGRQHSLRDGGTGEQIIREM
jgi:hypothetical protein